jgi:hypothetical protein
MGSPVRPSWRARRSAFPIEGDTVRAAWMLGPKLSDVDEVIAGASSLSD